LGMIGETTRIQAVKLEQPAQPGLTLPSAVPADQQTDRTASAAKIPTGQLQIEQGPVDGQRPPSPLARRIAAEYNVDISQVKGNSPHGRVTKDDVISYMEQNS